MRRTISVILHLKGLRRWWCEKSILKGNSNKNIYVAPYCLPYMPSSLKYHITI